MASAIWWIRRDLRFMDNDALRAALADGRAVYPVFILDPALLRGQAPRREAFLIDGLRRLDEDLRKRGSRLIVRSGSPLAALRDLAVETGATAIYAGEDVSPYSRKRDTEIIKAGLPLHLVEGNTVYPAGQVLKADSQPYTVFTPYSRAWLAMAFPFHRLWSPPARFPDATPVPSLEIPQVDSLAWGAFPPGEAEALARLEAFCAGKISFYADERDRLDHEGTSSLSPYLRFGMLSPVRAVYEARQTENQGDPGSALQGCQRWINELIWREFYHAILYHFPFVNELEFNPALRNIAWRDAQADLWAWQEGNTGYPVVDACMRQLAQTGWMHNRGRMIVASFLVKDLLIDWREGERWFMRHLLDGDRAANNGGWQWTAGVGTDAAPYFRVFNPVLQGEKFDPQGDFVRRWVPEIAHLPNKIIHQPWRASAPVRGYPAPMVDHAMARGRVLAAYQAGR